MRPQEHLRLQNALLRAELHAAEAELAHLSTSIAHAHTLQSALQDEMVAVNRALVQRLREFEAGPASEVGIKGSSDAILPAEGDAAEAHDADCGVLRSFADMAHAATVTVDRVWPAVPWVWVPIPHHTTPHHTGDPLPTAPCSAAVCRRVPTAQCGSVEGFHCPVPTVVRQCTQKI